MNVFSVPGVPVRIKFLFAFSNWTFFSYFLLYFCCSYFFKLFLGEDEIVIVALAPYNRNGKVSLYLNPLRYGTNVNLHLASKSIPIKTETSPKSFIVSP